MKKFLLVAMSAALLCGAVSITTSPVYAATYTFDSFEAKWHKEQEAAPETMLVLKCTITSEQGGTVAMNAFYKQSPSSSYVTSVGQLGTPALLPLTIGAGETKNFEEYGWDTYRGPYGHYKVEVHHSGVYLNNPGHYAPSPIPQFGW